MEAAKNTDVVDSNENVHNWYSLRVISGKEKIVEQNILYESKENDIEQLIDEVFVPFEKVIELKNNKKVVKEKMFFPGYMLINMNMNGQSKYIVENTPGVLSLVGPRGSDPIPLKKMK